MSSEIICISQFLCRCAVISVCICDNFHFILLHIRAMALCLHSVYLFFFGNINNEFDVLICRVNLTIEEA